MALKLRRDTAKLGTFKSYKEIGEWLAENGETGSYYVLPANMTSLAAIKEIKVDKYWDEYEKRWEREIEMEGSYF